MDRTKEFEVIIKEFEKLIIEMEENKTIDKNFDTVANIEYLIEHFKHNTIK